VVPLYVVLLRTFLRDRPSPRTLIGVGIGFVGLGVLLLPGTRPAGVPLGYAVLVLFGSLTWSIGSVISTRVALPKDPLVTTLSEMLGGAMGLAIVGLARGEQLPSQAPPASSYVGLAYLVVFGSVVAFTAYSWLLGTAPVSRVSTYAYVNPVVAVVLGALVRDEKLTTTSVVGGLITVVAVAVVVSEQPAAQEPADLQGLVRSAST
jgi:drug/metabolite transporter (DMT)-like permease